jgi:hypothetical protein
LKWIIGKELKCLVIMLDVVKRIEVEVGRTTKTEA